MSLTSIDEALFKEFEGKMRERMIMLRSRLSAEKNLEENKDLYINEIRRCKTYLVSKNSYRLEVAPGFYYLSHLMLYSLKSKTEEFWIHGKMREAYQNEDMDEFRRLCGDDETVVSDYGIADNIEQIQEYLKKIEPMTGLDSEKYCVVLNNHPPRDEEWRKFGPYIGTADDPSRVPVITWHIMVMP